MKDKMRQVETQDLQRLSLFQKSKIQPEESVLFNGSTLAQLPGTGNLFWSNCWASRTYVRRDGLDCSYWSILLVNAVTVNTKVFLSLL